MSEKNNLFPDTLQELGEQLKKSIDSATTIKGISIDMLFPEYENLKRTLAQFQKNIQEIVGISVFEKIESNSRISGADNAFLQENYWVIPFEFEYDKLKELREMKRITEFEDYMIKYHGDSRMERQFSKIRNGYKEKDKKELLNQIEKAYNDKNYAICITCLITLLDGTTIELLDSKSNKKHSSHQIIEVLKDYMNKPNERGFGYELFQRVSILNNFYDKLYKNRNFTNEITKELSRHLNTHGVIYLNDQINVLRLLDAIFFCQEILNEIGMKNEFIYRKENKKFTIK